MLSQPFRKCFDLTGVPPDWQLKGFTLDWDGNPLLLFVEGKPPRISRDVDLEGWLRWRRAVPVAHHVVYWEENRLHSLSFDQSQGLSTCCVQRFEEGWLLGDGRGGHATIYDARGVVRLSLNLGDAIEDLQTTPDGNIWVSYFDEGVFGGGIGNQGVVCFDRGGAPIFRYAVFAEENNLPEISDCYAMNVDDTGAVWLNYYMDFPLVRLRNFELDQVWKDFHVLGRAFAVRGNDLVHVRKKGLFLTRLLSPHEEPVNLLPEDETGKAIPMIRGYAARGSNVAIYTGESVYTMCS